MANATPGYLHIFIPAAAVKHHCLLIFERYQCTLVDVCVCVCEQLARGNLTKLKMTRHFCTAYKGLTGIEM